MDKSWEQYGYKDPYFAVLTDSRYKTGKIDDLALHEFFLSGEEHVDLVLKKMQYYFHLPASHKFKNVLDFGCGTGRLVIPFAKKFEKVVGIDISVGMLREAEKNLKERKINNVSLIQSGNITLLDFSEKFDLIHTFIVLQHIPVAQGYKIIEKLLDSLEDGGYGMIHLTYENNHSFLQNLNIKIQASNKLYHQFFNLIRGRDRKTPLMQMNNYSLPKVFSILKHFNIKHISLDFTDHGGALGVCFYLKK